MSGLAAEGEKVLHPSHRWGQRPILERTESGGNVYRERKIPFCLACWVDGYEDEWDAFQPCRPIFKALTTTETTP